WTWWYVLRPFIGVVLALVIYFGIRGGLLLVTTNAGSSVTEAKDINPFGIAAFAALTGMFSKQAADKLNEIFSVIFKPAPGEGDERRLDGLTSKLAISRVDPPQGPTTGGTPVVITGTGFLHKAQVTFGGLAATSVVFQSETSIEAVTPPSAVAGPVAVEVANPDGKKATATTGYIYVADLTSPPGP
ncbi:MAG: IPT/TIG domain-containing protein, partial [Pyrinomonadaceae bacterium]